MIRIGILGAAGRMGKELISLLTSGVYPKLILQKTFISPHSKVTGSYEILSLKGLNEVDVLIDFSENSAIIQAIPLIKELRKPLIIGTTGFSEVQREEIKKLSEGVAIVLAPNTSIGVNVLIKLIEEAITLLPETFDVNILEIHHQDKKDAPSGTALKLKEHLQKMTRRVIPAKAGIHEPTSIPVQSIRGGDVIGEHHVLFLGAGEEIELSHKATSRDIFAKGALQAAEWIIHQKPGLYTMQDVLRGSLPS